MSDDRLVIRASEMTDTGRRDGGRFCLVQRDRLGLGEVSVGVSDNPSGTEVATHRHLCGELFVVYEGRGVYTIGETEIVATPGDIVIVPPNTWHSFRPDAGMSLRHVAAYDSGHVTIEFATGRAISS